MGKSESAGGARTSFTMLNIFSSLNFALLVCSGLYFAFLGLLIVPSLQAQVIYLNKVKLTWFKDVNVPEQWGFLPRQVTPFHLHTSDGEKLHAWHILPLSLYLKHERALLAEPAGLVDDFNSRISLSLLRDEPDSLLVLYLHGAAGTLASGHRPSSYRAISALAPSRIHIVGVDWRGFGTSTGVPSEDGLLVDALALVKWATETAGIPPDRIVLFSQSLGTAVGTQLVHHLSQLSEPTFFKGLIMVAPFADVKSLTATYKVGGTIPILSPLAKVPPLLVFFHRFIRSHWPTAETLAKFVTGCEQSTNTRSHYYINLIHAKDDYDIPWTHSEEIYWNAVDASLSDEAKAQQAQSHRKESREHLAGGGWVVHKETDRGVLRQQITEYGLHDWIMGYPIVSTAVARAFGLEEAYKCNGT